MSIGLSRTSASFAACVAAVVLSLLLFARPAHGEAFGELGQVGSFGTGLGEFQWPGDLAVDPTDNSVYVADEPQRLGSERPGAGPASFRIQKFAATLGKPVASATVPTPEEVVGEEHHLKMIQGMAVDPSLHRLYVLVAVQSPGGLYEASQIYAYSTDNGSTEVLPVAPGVPQVEIEPGVKVGLYYTFTAPAGKLEKPQGIAVDPTTHDLIVVGVDVEHTSTVVQRIHSSEPSNSTGALSATFDDEANPEKVLTAEPNIGTGVAVGANGSIYLVTKSVAVSREPGIVMLSPDFATATVVRQEEVTSNPTITGGSEGGRGRDFGPQIAVSPEQGGLVYAAATNEPEQPGKVAGNYEIRGMSTADGSQRVVFGHGTAPDCQITSAASAIAAGSGGVVYGLDEGAYNIAAKEPSTFGFHLVKFGPGGSGCPTPVAAFNINGDESSTTVRIKKGEPVTYQAVGSQLNGEEPVELDWDLDGSGTYATKVSGSPAELAVTHEYFETGTYTIGLQIFLFENGSFGNPPPAARKIEVVAPLPTAVFDVSDASPKSGEEVSFDAGESLDPTGLCSPGSGCGPTHELESYTWSFGDGQVEKTGSSKFARAFTNASSTSRTETVALTVTNKEGVSSSALTETLMVQGAGGSTTTPPPSGGGGSNSGAGGQPSTNSSPGQSSSPGQASGSTKPAPKPLTRAQKLAKALKVCKKLKAKKKRVRCEKLAKKKYAPKRSVKK